MALLLAEAAKLSTDTLQRGVIETIIYDSPILQTLPFMTIEGNSYKYNQENTLGSADFYGVNAVWAESAATFTQQSATLAILGGDADVDNFIQRTLSNIQDQRAVQVAKKSKAVRQKFESTFVVGTVAGDPNSFNGVGALITNANQIVTAGANGAALTLAMLDDLIDRVKGGQAGHAADEQAEPAQAQEPADRVHPLHRAGESQLRAPGDDVRRHPRGGLRLGARQRGAGGIGGGLLDDLRAVVRTRVADGPSERGHRGGGRGPAGDQGRGAGEDQVVLRPGAVQPAEVRKADRGERELVREWGRRIAGPPPKGVRRLWGR